MVVNMLAVLHRGWINPLHIHFVLFVSFLHVLFGWNPCDLHYNFRSARYECIYHHVFYYKYNFWWVYVFILFPREQHIYKWGGSGCFHGFGGESLRWPVQKCLVQILR